MMRKLKQMRGWSLGALLVAIVLATSGAHAAVPVVVAGELVGATGVNVDGAVYDVQFVEGSCVDVYGGCDDVSDFPFTTLADATLAAQALLDLVLRDTAAGDFDSFPDQVFGCTNVAVCGAQTPFALPDATNVTITSAVNSSVETSDSASELDWDRTEDFGTGTLAEFANWVVWTPVPPATPNVVLGELKGAFNVNLDGTLYDVDFVEGSCVDVYHGCDDVLDFRFTTEADATLAANALLDQVLLNSAAGDFDSFPDQVFGCTNPAVCGAQIPFALPDPTKVKISSAVNSTAETSDAPATIDWERTEDFGTGTLAEFASWVIWTPVPTATPNVVLGELKGAANVNVGGTLYDVDFVEGSCVDVYGGCDEVSDFPFTTEADATLAARALLDHVLRDTAAGDFDSFPDQVFGCTNPAVCGAQTPFALPDATNVKISSAVNASVEASDAPNIIDWDRTEDFGTGSLAEFASWAVWTLAGTDSDGDGIPNATDNCPAIANAGQQDADSDGAGDACDLCPGFDDGVDGDSDAVPDGCDVCPGFDDQVDSDGDTVADGCDVCPGGDDNVDADTDTVPDFCDNCPSDANAGQADVDSDGVGDTCDVCPGSDDGVDSDSDGAPDGCDICPGFDDGIDSDSDGVPDGCDICPGSNDAIDADSDGVPDGCDNCPNAANPGQADADVDGVGDACDACPGFDDALDADGDTVPDGCDICGGFDDLADSDGDTVPDGCDVCPGGDDNVDSDGDTVPDGCDICAPSAGSLIRMTIDGQVFSAPQFLAGTIDVGDPINFDVIVDTALPNEATPPDFLVSNAGYLTTFLILDVIGNVDSISVTDATTRWSLRTTLDLTAALPGFYATMAIAIDNPANSGLVPVVPGNTYQIGAVNLEPTLQGRVFFNVLSVTSVPEPNPSDDTVDTDGDAVPDDCDACPVDNPDDTDSDGVCESLDICPGGDDNADADGDAVPDACDVCPAGHDTLDADSDGVADGCDNCPADSNPSQADSDEDGIGDACDATPTANVPGLQGWGLMALVVLVVSSSLMMMKRERRDVIVR